MSGLFRLFAMSPIRTAASRTHPAGCGCQTGRSKSQVVTCKADDAICCRRLSLQLFLKNIFLAKNTPVVIGQFVVGAPASGLDAKKKNAVQVKRQGLLITHTHTLQKISRERGDLSGCVYLYGIRVTDVGGKFSLPKGLTYTRSCLGLFFFSSDDCVKRRLCLVLTDWRDTHLNPQKCLKRI